MIPPQWLRWWRAPFWAAALVTGAKSFADNPILGSRRLNRAGLHGLRLKIAHRLAWRRRRSLARAVPAAWRDQFDRNGFIAIPEFLPPDEFARLRDSLLTGEWETRAHQQGDTITRRAAVGPELLGAVPALGRLFASKRWRGLLAYVAASRSQPLYYVQAVAGGVAEGPPDPQLELHSDAFHPALKAWLFLTDVADDGRPLTYVAGSHLLTSQRLQWEQDRAVRILDDGDPLSRRGSLRIAPAELAGLGLAPPVRFAVPANTLVAIDTFGFHARAASDQPTLRVELWAYCRRTPFLPWTGFDPLSFPPLAMRRAEWMYRIVDRLDGLGVMKQHWQPAGRRRPAEP